MEIAVQLMMGISLAACTGLRAFLPLLIASLLTSAGYVKLNPAFGFLEEDWVLLVLVVATVVEFAGDKFPGIDHALDVVGTAVRPAVATVLTSSMLAEVDPAVAIFLGLMAGGSTSFVVHAVKATVRAKSTILTPLHLGTGNVGLSLAEDVAATSGSLVAIAFPVLAFLVTITLLVIAVWVGIHLMNKGVGFVQAIRGRRKGGGSSDEDDPASDGLASARAG